MPNTPTLNLPYPTVLTQPKGAAQIQALAENTERAILDNISVGGASGLVVNVKDQPYGAAGDGVADDTAAIQAAIAAAGNAGTVWFPAGTYNYAGALAITTPVALNGGGQATLRQTASIANWIDMADSGGVVRGLGLDGNSLVSGRIIVPKIEGLVEYCAISNTTGVSAVGVRIFDPLKAVVQHCTIDNVGHGVYITGGDHCTVHDNWIRNWIQRAIYVPTTNTLATDYLTLSENLITDVALSGAGTVRQPISFQGDTTLLNTFTRILKNVVVGPNLDAEGTGASQGTADQISLHSCRGYEISGNVSVYGGDLGINVSEYCYGGTISFNECLYNDNSGINLGSSSTNPVDGATVFGNTCMNNGQVRNGTPPSGAGIRLYRVNNAVVEGNTLTDDQAIHTQNYAISMLNACTGIHLGPNARSGNVGGYLNSDGTNTGCTIVSETAQT